MSEKDGGPAFPEVCTTGERMQLLRGMSLRDWFAGQALATVDLADVTAGAEAAGIDAADTKQLLSVVARHVYNIADAMLAQREEGGE